MIKHPPAINPLFPAAIWPLQIVYVHALGHDGVRRMLSDNLNRLPFLAQQSNQATAQKAEKNVAGSIHIALSANHLVKGAFQMMHDCPFVALLFLKVVHAAKET